MNSEIETIEILLDKFNSNLLTGFDWMLKDLDEEDKKYYRKCINIMHGLDFIKIESMAHMGGQNLISLTSKGRAVIINGGYKKYLIREAEKEKIEKEIYDNTKENLSVAKSSKRWVIISVILAVITLLLSIVWHYSSI